MAKKVNRKRLFMDFLKIGRTGSVYKLYGAPGDLEGPYDSHEEALQAQELIIKGEERFVLEKRKIVDLGAKDA